MLKFVLFAVLLMVVVTVGWLIWRARRKRGHRAGEGQEGKRFAISRIYEEHVFPIKGINYRKLDQRLRPGFFHGCIRREPDNSHDPYAVAIYNKEGIHMGYLPAGNVDMCNRLDGQEGGCLEVYGYAQRNIYGPYWFGKVFVLYDIPEEDVPIVFQYFEYQNGRVFRGRFRKSR